MPPKQVLINEALKLSESDRIDVAEALYQSVEGPGDPDTQHAWADEIADRLAVLDNAGTSLLSWDDARRKITEDGPA